METPPHDAGAQRKLHKLLANARENEEKQRRLNALEFMLIATPSLAELGPIIVAELPRRFALDYVTLALLDPEGEIAGSLERAGLSPAGLPALLTTLSPNELAAVFPLPGAPHLGSFVLRRHGFLFPEASRHPASVALLPLVRRNQLIGSLNLGSDDPRRFTPDTGGDFLERLAAVTAICVENGVIYERLKELGYTDPLTGVHNRRHFEERLEQEWNTATATDAPLACLFVDVDHFKYFNDRCGHQAGDQVLREVARIARAHLRPRDALSRYGGEEFVALLPGCAQEEALQLAEGIRTAVQTHEFRIAGHGSATITISVGVAVAQLPIRFPGPGDLVRAADKAVYQAKAAGRNRVTLSTAQGTAAE